MSGRRVSVDTPYFRDTTMPFYSLDSVLGYNRSTGGSHIFQHTGRMLKRSLRVRDAKGTTIRPILSGKQSDISYQTGNLHVEPGTMKQTTRFWLLSEGFQMVSRCVQCWRCLRPAADHMKGVFATGQSQPDRWFEQNAAGMQLRQHHNY